MSNQRLAETYLARARELEDHAQRVEQNPRAVQFSCKLGILSTKLRSRAARHRVLRTFRPPSALIKL
jgi:hypothetical protein